MDIKQLGPYRLLRRLGRGGMGMVFEGQNLETDQTAAIKMLDHGLAQEEGFRERFRTEIETLRKLNHPGIVRLFGFGEQDDHFFYVMEFVPGASLEQQLQAGRRFTWRDVARWAIEICLALRHAHDRGIIHRDLKPANLLLDHQGHVKLADFGIARLFGHARITTIGSVLGTAEYMSPEQADGLPVDHRSDLYSLGAVLYALLCGRPPFQGRSLPEILQKQRFGQPEPLKTFAPEVPEEFQAIVTQLLDKNPERRFPNASVLMRRIEGMLENLATVSSTIECPLEVQPDAAAQLPAAEPSVTKTSPHAMTPDADEDHHKPSELPVTRSTSAFQGLPAVEWSAPSPDSEAGQDDQVPAADSSPASGPHPSHPLLTQPGTRFVQVTDLDPDSLVSDDRSHPWLPSLQTWLLAASLVAVAATLWYFLQPPTADQLYQAITVHTTDLSMDSLLRAEGDIEKFLARFPSDSRSNQLRDYAKEIQLYRLERKFARRAAGLLRGETLLPVEQAYLEAIQLSHTNPDQAIVKLQSLMALYDHRADTSGPADQCVELARRRLERLRKQVAGYAAQHLEALQDRLNLADSLDQADPPRARAIREAVVDLYAAKPWADPAVTRARDALSRHSGASVVPNDAGPKDVSSPAGK